MTGFWSTTFMIPFGRSIAKDGRLGPRTTLPGPMLMEDRRSGTTGFLQRSALTTAPECRGLLQRLPCSLKRASAHAPSWGDKRHEGGRQVGTARRRDGQVEAPAKSSFPSLASVPRSDLHRAPAVRPLANTP